MRRHCVGVSDRLDAHQVVSRSMMFVRRPETFLDAVTSVLVWVAARQSSFFAFSVSVDTQIVGGTVRSGKMETRVRSCRMEW